MLNLISKKEIKIKTTVRYTYSTTRKEKKEKYKESQKCW